jgi:hypothetical protein
MAYKLNPLETAQFHANVSVGSKPVLVTVFSSLAATLARSPIHCVGPMLPRAPKRGAGAPVPQDDAGDEPARDVEAGSDQSSGDSPERREEARRYREFMNQQQQPAASGTASEASSRASASRVRSSTTTTTTTITSARRVQPSAAAAAQPRTVRTVMVEPPSPAVGNSAPAISGFGAQPQVSNNDLSHYRPAPATTAPAAAASNSDPSNANSAGAAASSGSAGEPSPLILPSLTANAAPVTTTSVMASAEPQHWYVTAPPAAPLQSMQAPRPLAPLASAQPLAWWLFLILIIALFLTAALIFVVDTPSSLPSSSALSFALPSHSLARFPFAWLCHTQNKIGNYNNNVLYDYRWMQISLSLDFIGVCALMFVLAGWMMRCCQVYARGTVYVMWHAMIFLLAG